MADSCRLRGCHPLWQAFPSLSAKNQLSMAQSYNPGEHAHRFGLFRFRSPLLAESLICFLFLCLLRCFSSAGSRRFRHVFNMPGCPIRTPADQGSFAPPRRFSQLTASFVASGSQGIPHAPLVRFRFAARRLAPGVLFQAPSRFSGRSSPAFEGRLGSLSSTKPFLLSLSFSPSLVNELFISGDGRRAVSGGLSPGRSSR